MFVKQLSLEGCRGKKLKFTVIFPILSMLFRMLLLLVVSEGDAYDALGAMG